MTALTVNVPGVPAPQGSLKSFGNGRMTHSNPATLPWRASIIAHVRQQMDGHPDTEWPIEGPVKLAVTFHLPRPKSAPKWRMWPDKKPDLDRLIRACGDALTQSGCIRDDAQIVLISADKAYGVPGMSLFLRSLEQPARKAS